MALSPIGVAHNLVKEGKLPGLPDVFHHGGHQPQCVIGAGVRQAVDNGVLVRGGDDGGRFESGLVRLGAKPDRVKEMEAVARGSQPLQELLDALFASFRVGVGMVMVSWAVSR